MQRHQGERDYRCDGFRRVFRLHCARLRGAGTAIDVDFRDIPSHGTGFGLGGGVASGGVTDIHPHGGIWSGFNPKIPFCDEIAKLRASHDDLIMCHSQGCNITMHAVNESCKQP